MREKTISHLAGLGLDVTERTNVLLAYWDNDLVCRFANRAFSDWFGYSPEQMIDRIHISELLGPVYAKYSVHFATALAGKPQTFERPLITPSGERKQIRVTLSPDYEDGIVKGVFAHVADITKLHNADLRQSELTEHIEGFVSDVDDKLDEVIETLRSCILTEFPGIEGLAKKHFISESKLKREFKQRYKTTIFSYYRDLQMELAHKYLSEKKCNKGQMALMLNFSNPSNFSVCYKKYVNEISVKELVGKIKKESDERFKIFVEQSPVDIAMLDNNLVFMAASQRFLDTRKINVNEYIGKYIFDVIHGFAMEYKEMLRGCLKGNTNVTKEAFVERADGSSFWLNWEVKPWYTIDKQIGGLLIFTEDITAEKLIEAENKVIGDILTKANEITRVGAWQRNFRTNSGVWSKILKEILEVPEDFIPDVSTGLNFYREGPHRELVKIVLKNALEKGQSFDIETEIITAKGNLKKVRIIGFPKFFNGKCETISGIFQDITHNTSIS